MINKFTRSLKLLSALGFLLLQIVTSNFIYVDNSFTASTCNVIQAECGNIQSALDIAADSDTVILNPGTYTGYKNYELCADNCSFSNVTISGATTDPSDVVISYDNSNGTSVRAMYMTSNQITQLKYLTIENFNGTILITSSFITVPFQLGGGSAIWVTGSSVIVDHVIFQNNVGILGAAMNFFNSNLTMNSCEFYGNVAELGGGAIATYLSDSFIENSIFEGNNVTSSEILSTASVGGALYILGGTSNVVGIKNSAFRNNKAERGGGAVYMESDSRTQSDLGAFFSDSVIYEGNYGNGVGTCVSTASCNTRGGALYLTVPSVFIKNSSFVDNKVSSVSENNEAQGGAVYSTNLYNVIQSSKGTRLDDCTFLNNVAEGQGGAMYVINQGLMVTNVTFTKNSVKTVSALFTDAPSQGGAIWYSANSLVSEISYCTFTGNVAYSGWGGAIFGTETTGLLSVTHSHFINNAVYSSYTNAAQGGAIMVASGFSLKIEHSHFQNNTALPHLNLVPLTYSGSGGGVFVQSSNFTINDCRFYDNFALTGQFDAGSAGGALVLEDSYPVFITSCKFKNNGAAGYYGYSSFAAPGTGGAIYVKFSAANILYGTFEDNWVSAGGSDNSIGGAVAVYFDYSSVSTVDDPDEGVVIERSVFRNNTAYGQLCLLNGQSGEGGAVGIVGTSSPAVQLSYVNFTDNAALASTHSLLSSMGGAVSITLSSNVSADNCFFADNSAIQGAGNDIASVSGQNDQQNFISFKNSTFTAATNAAIEEMTINRVDFEYRICSFLASEQTAASGPHRRLLTESDNIFPTYSPSEVSSRNQAILDKLQGIYRDGLNFDISSVTVHNQKLRRKQQQDRIAHILQQLTIVDTYLLINAPEISGKITGDGHFNVPLEVELMLRSTGVGTRSHTDRVDSKKYRKPTSKIIQNQRVILGFTYKDSLIKELEVYKQQRFHRTRRMASTEAGPVVVPEGSTPYSLQHNNRLLTVNEKKKVSKQDALYAKDPEKHERIFKNTIYSKSGKLSEFNSESFDWKHRRLEENLDFLNEEQEEMRNLISTSTATFFNSTTLRSLLAFHPDIVVTSGEAIFGDPTFISAYHMFFGDYYEFLTSSSSTSVEDDSASSSIISSLPSTSIIYGDILQDHLIVTVLKATLTLYSSKHIHNNFELSQVNIFNGTLYISNNITILDDSFVSDSTISGVRSSSNLVFDYIVNNPTYAYLNKSLSNPIIEFNGILYTGYNIGDILAYSNNARSTNTAENYYNVTQQSILTLDSCQLAILNRMILDSPIENPETYDYVSSTGVYEDPSYEYANIKFLLNNDALVNVSTNGIMVILSDTLIKATNSSSPAIYNSGEVTLLGDTESIVNAVRLNKGTGKSTTYASRGSLTSTLTVYGDYTQTMEGTLSVILNSSYATSPVVSLYSNKSFSGALNISFYVEAATSDYPDLVLYNTDNPSNWPVISFTVMESAGVNAAVKDSDGITPPAYIEAPTGLRFTGNIARNPYVLQETVEYEKNVPNYVQTLVVTNIGCDMVSTYYSGVADMATTQYPCYICLLNSSCNLCGNNQCGLAGTCGDDVAYSSNCCNSNCNNPYGTCQANSDHTSFSCFCNSFFYGGKFCDELTTDAILLISSAVSIVLFAALGLYFYQRAKKQKKIVLDELRGDLLRNTEGSNNEYIQYMQQALILNDVFVKFEDIKLESKIGEGSFGVVHKATFRGAQVAVKQMRSMFLELTEKEIEEFRKEAYVMSRLRHPNIVLVMGISLVDQEPIPLPKTRSVTQQALNDSIMASAQKDGEKKKPPKTVCIITEFLEQGSLADILYGPTRLPAEVWTYELVLTCALQAARGMLYLHSHSPPICHRDLKSSNLVVDDHWVVKVTDFGMSRIVPEKIQDQDKGLVAGPEDREYFGRESVGSISENLRDTLAGERSGHSVASLTTLNTAGGTRVSHFSPEMTSNLGTTAWCAPELLTTASKTHYSVKVDVYSFGMVLWELWEKKRPFDEYNSRFDIMDAIRSGKRPEISNNCPPTYRSLLQRCWQTNPTRRPNFTYIVRYLKDELALVKRKRGNTLGGGNIVGYRGDIFLSTSVPTYTPDQLTRNNDGDDRASTSYQEFMDNDPDRPSFLRRSFHAVKEAVAASPAPQIFAWNRKSNASQDKDRTSSSSASAAAAAKLGNSNESAQNRGSNVGAIMLNELHNSGGGKGSASVNDTRPSNVERRSSGNNLQTPLPGGEKTANVPVNLPEGRTPLVAAVDRSLSYLADSPSPAGYMTSQGGASAPRAGPKGRNDQWRDKYVMKFNGWNKEKPDAGLPPSLAASTVSPMMTSSGSGVSLPHLANNNTPTPAPAPHRGSATAGPLTPPSSNLTNELNRQANNERLSASQPSAAPIAEHTVATSDTAATSSSVASSAETPAVVMSIPSHHMDSPVFNPEDQSGIFDIDPDDEPLPPPVRQGSGARDSH